MASDWVREQTNFWTNTRSSLAIGCLSMFALTEMSSSQFMYPSTYRYSSCYSLRDVDSKFSLFVDNFKPDRFIQPRL